MDARQSSVELNDTDIRLAEPFEAHKVAPLRWWLLCRGICTNFLAKASDHSERHRLSVPEPLANIVCLFFLRKAMHGHARVFRSSIATRNTHITRPT